MNQSLQFSAKERMLLALASLIGAAVGAFVGVAGGLLLGDIIQRLVL